MRTSKLSVAAAASLIVGLLFSGCAANEQTDPAASGATGGTSQSPTLSGTLAGAGASSQTAAQEAWRAGFQSLNTGVTIDYDPTGSGAGREAFVAGGVGFAGTDSAFSIKDITTGGFAACKPNTGIVELPMYISPIAVGFNLNGVTALNLDAETIAKIFRAEITKWNDPAIAAQNSTATLPDLAITPIHRSDKSGTTGNFTDYLSQAAPSVWIDGKTEEWPAGLAGEAAEKTQGVRQSIVAVNGAIGYLDASQAQDMSVVAIKVGSSYVVPSATAATAAVSASPVESGRSTHDIVVQLNRTLTDAGVYPLVLISYLVACESYVDANQGQLVRNYLAYAASAEGQQAAAKNAGSAPITGNAILEPKVNAAIAAIS